jgi:hypothetical protein
MKSNNEPEAKSGMAAMSIFDKGKAILKYFFAIIVEHFRTNFSSTPKLIQCLCQLNAKVKSRRHSKFLHCLIAETGSRPDFINNTWAP